MIATTAGLSKLISRNRSTCRDSRLRHLFKAEIGLPPARYVRMRKMQEAKLLLETTFLTVKRGGEPCWFER